MELCTSESKKCAALFTKTKSFCKLKTMEVYEEHVFNVAILRIHVSGVPEMESHAQSPICNHINICMQVHYS